MVTVVWRTGVVYLGQSGALTVTCESLAMSMTPRSVLPAVVFCAGIVLFVLGWRTAGLVLAAAPVVVGVLVVVWALVKDRSE
jgi:hypothetical protein